MRASFAVCSAMVLAALVPASAGQPVTAPIDAAATALKVGGATEAAAWLVEGEGLENLDGELQGLADGEPTWRPHQERVAVDAVTETVGWERRTPRNDFSLRHRRFVYAPAGTLIVDHANGLTREAPGAVPEVRRRALMRRIPHLLVADAWRNRAGARSNRAVAVDGRAADEIALDLPGDGTVHLVIGRSPAVLHSATYPLYFPGRGDITVRWDWTGWKEHPQLGHVPSGHRLTIDGILFQEVQYTRYERGSREIDGFLNPPAQQPSGAAEPPAWTAAAGPATGEVAPGVHVARMDGFTVGFVELRDAIVAFEAPEPFFGTESIPAADRQAAGTLSPRIVAHIRRTVPGKPISHVVVSHHHGDHLGGVKAFAEAGAIPIVAARDRAAAQRALGGTSRAPEPVEDVRVLSDGVRRIEIIEVGENPHTRSNLVMWLPAERILLQGDLFYFNAGAGLHRGRDRMNRYFSRWLKARGLAPRLLYGVHNNGAAGPGALEAAAALPDVDVSAPRAQVPVRLVASEFPDNLRSFVEQVAAVHAKLPDDPSVLYQVAAVHARAGHTEQALAAIERMTATGAGLHPRLRDGFQGLSGHPAFETLLARIRKEHPPARRARLAFEIAEADLVSEGIAWSERTRTLYFGSIKRKIVAATPDGVVRTLVPPATGGLGVVLGIRVDDRRGELWAVSGSITEPPADLVAGIFRFRLADGHLLRAYAIPGSHKDMLNDLSVAPDGQVYVTATNTGALLRLDPDSGRVDTFLGPGTLPDPNGIGIRPQGDFAFVAGWYGITRVDLRTRESLMLAKAPGVADGCIDGLYVTGPRELVGVQNCVHETGRLLRLRLSADLARVEAVEVLESYNPLFEGIMTAAIAGRRVYFSANSQFRRLSPDGRPLRAFDPVRILVLDLE